MSTRTDSSGQQVPYRKQKSGHRGCRKIECCKRKAEQRRVCIERLSRVLENEGAESGAGELFREHHYEQIAVRFLDEEEQEGVERVGGAARERDAVAFQQSFGPKKDVDGYRE
jgi:hypothetical protein